MSNNQNKHKKQKHTTNKNTKQLNNQNNQTMDPKGPDRSALDLEDNNSNVGSPLTSAIA